MDVKSKQFIKKIHKINKGGYYTIEDKKCQIKFVKVKKNIIKEKNIKKFQIRLKKQCVGRNMEIYIIK